MNEDEIPLDDSPMAAEQILFTEDMYSTDQTLAADGQEQSIWQTRVNVGVPVAYNLRVDDATAIDGRPDAHLWRFVLIQFRFDLAELKPGRSYASARFQVEFEDPQVLADRLDPETVNTEEDAERSRVVRISPGFAFDGAELSLGGISTERRFRFTKLHPVVRSHGARRNTFYWEYATHQTQELVPGDRSVLARLQLPRGNTTFFGNIRVWADINRRIGGLFKKHQADTRVRKFVFDQATGAFSLIPAED